MKNILGKDVAIHCEALPEINKIALMVSHYSRFVANTIFIFIHCPFSVICIDYRHACGKRIRLLPASINDAGELLHNIHRDPGYMSGLQVVPHRSCP